MTLCIHHGLPAVDLRASDGARAVITLDGGHLVSWIAAGSQDEQLYMSPRSAYAPGQAIRGGVPVVFPQFSDRGPLARHGFARTKTWQLLRTHAGEGGGAVAILRLTDDDQSRAIWPHSFELDLTVRIGGNQLGMELSCLNTGTTTFSFASALHTYLRVHDVALAGLEGLTGCGYWDAVDGQDKTQTAPALVVHGEVDQVYAGIHRDLVLRDTGAAASRALLVGQQGFEDVVVWNPGATRCAALPDMPAQGHRNMLCVEAGLILKPVQLRAGQRWAGAQNLTVLA